MRRALALSMLLPVLLMLVVPDEVLSQEFDPQTYFLKKAEGKKKDGTVKKDEGAGGAQKGSAVVFSGGSPFGRSPVFVWIAVAGGAIAVAVVFLIGWLMATSGSMVPRIDKDIEREMRDFIDEVGEEEFIGLTGREPEEKEKVNDI